MAKTRKNKRPPLTLSNSTSANLDRWFEHMLEEVGYMIMAKGKGMLAKVRAYKKSFENLINTIERVREEYVDPDRKRDLGVLHKKATYVYGFVKKHL